MVWTDPLEPLAADFVQQEREDDRCREAEDEAVEAKEQGVADESEKVGAIDELAEPLESDPRAADVPEAKSNRLNAMIIPYMGP